jgi:hypothetical protein
MKSALNQISLKNIALIVLCMTSLTLFGQTVPQIDIRFANPSYDRDTRTYAVDVELKSMTEPEMFFGMNLRFFYDASLLQFKGIDQFHKGYGFLGDPPKAIVGSQTSGTAFFDFDNAAGYINGTVIIVNESTPLNILTDAWTKAFRVTFKVPVTTYNKASFCPSLIWDKEIDPANGGFIPGSEGMLISVIERDRTTRADLVIANSYGYPFNWEYFPVAGMPHGKIAATDCIPVTKTLVTEEQDKSHVDGYDIFQNTPNPFEGETTIAFKLPSAQAATIELFDVDGVVKETIEGYYESGTNKVVLKKKSWMVESGIIYYRLQTDKFTSRSIAMTLVRA